MPLSFLARLSAAYYSSAIGNVLSGSSYNLIIKLYEKNPFLQFHISKSFIFMVPTLFLHFFLLAHLNMRRIQIFLFVFFSLLINCSNALKWILWFFISSAVVAFIFLLFYYTCHPSHILFFATVATEEYICCCKCNLKFLWFYYNANGYGNSGGEAGIVIAGVVGGTGSCNVPLRLLFY